MTHLLLFTDPINMNCPEWLVTHQDGRPTRLNVEFSSVQFARINVVLSAKALQDHDTVTSVIDAVVAGKEMSSGVAGMRTRMVQR